LGYLKRKTALLHARRISYAYDISPHSFLTRQVGETTAQIKTGSFEEPVPDSIRPIKRKKNDHEDIKKRATALLKEGGKPPTLKAFTEKLDISVGYLEYQQPELCRQVRKKRLAYLKEKRQAVLNSAKSSALNYFTDDRYADLPQSRKQAYKVLREETKLPKFVLVRAIDEAYQAINS